MEKLGRETAAEGTVVTDEGDTGLDATLVPPQNAAELARESYDKYLRAVADLDNYKKRALREKMEAVKFGNERLIGDILPIYDAIERAMRQVVALGGEQSLTIKKGLEMLLNKLLEVLGRHGVEVIESLHQAFDPYFHEALMQSETDDFPHNTVITEMEKGFMLNGRLLRPSRVEVSRSSKGVTVMETTGEKV